MLRKCGKHILPVVFPLVTTRIYQIMLLLLSISRVYFSKTICRVSVKEPAMIRYR